MNTCEECTPPLSLISNRSIEGTLTIERAFADAHDYVSKLPPHVLSAPIPQAHHGEWRDYKRYCVCCDAWADGINNPNECPGIDCGAPWEKP